MIATGACPVEADDTSKSKPGRCTSHPYKQAQALGSKLNPTRASSTSAPVPISLRAGVLVAPDMRSNLETCSLGVHRLLNPLRTDLSVLVDEKGDRADLV